MDLNCISFSSSSDDSNTNMLFAGGVGISLQKSFTRLYKETPSFVPLSSITNVADYKATQLVKRLFDGD